MTLLNVGANLYIRKGDTGNVSYTGLPQDKLYNVYLSIFNPDTFTIIKEVTGTYTQATGVVIFSLGVAITDALPVGEWEYAIKICANGSEDTILPRSYVDSEGNLIKENAPKFTVDEKLAEGDE